MLLDNKSIYIYLTNIRSILAYVAPALFSFTRSKLWKARKSPKSRPQGHKTWSRIWGKTGMFTHSEAPYLSYAHFLKVNDNKSHPLFSKLIFNNSSRPSSRAKFIFRPKLCRSEKRRKSFFNFFMTYHDNRLVSIQWVNFQLFF